MSRKGVLDGKIAIVTGSSRGIGKVISLHLAQAGAAVVVTGRSETSTRELPGSIGETCVAIEALGGRAIAIRADVTVDDDLIETDFGSWEGLTFGEAAQRDPELHTLWLRDSSQSPPDGESFDAVAHRVRRARNRIIAEHGDATVLVVSHVTPIKTILRLALDAGNGILYRLHLDLASLSIAEFYPDGASSVRLVNQTAYLTS